MTVPTHPAPTGALARRSVAVGARGAIAAGSATAASLGAGVLLAGGNAFDAALTAAFAETVLLPSKCGLAGDVVALFVRAGDAVPSSLVAIGPAGVRVRDEAADRGWPTPLTGGLSVGVPGAPTGYARLARMARQPLADLVAPARALARTGVVWSDTHARLAAEADDVLVRHQPHGCVYRPTAGPRAVGEVVALAGAAEVLAEFATAGADLFGGALGDRVVEYVARHGGVLDKADLVSARALTAAADVGRVGDHDLYVTARPTYGPALLDALADWSPARAPGVGPDDVRRAVARLRSAPVDEGTSTIAACDDSGNAVVLVHSTSFPQFGSGLVVPGLDLVLSNRAGRGFTWQPDHPNSPAPGRRPATTLHAWGFRDDETWVLGATPGGEQQVGWNAQLLDRLLRDASGLALGEALVAPRWDLAPGADGGRAVRHEGADLPVLGVRSSHTVVRSGWTLTAAADPRLDGGAVAV